MYVPMEIKTSALAIELETLRVGRNEPFSICLHRSDGRRSEGRARSRGSQETFQLFSAALTCCLQGR